MITKQTFYQDEVDYGRNYSSSNQSNGYDEETAREARTQYPSHDQMRVKLPPQNVNTSARPCANTNCEFYGTIEFDFFCSKCYNANTHQQNGRERTSPLRTKPEDLTDNNNSVLPQLTRQQHPLSGKVAQGR